MTWTALILFSLAIALWRYSQRQADEVTKFLALIAALISVLAGLAIAPLLLKGMSLAVLLIYPTCATGDRVLKPNCPRFCPFRHQCKPSSKSTLF